MRVCDCFFDIGLYTQLHYLSYNQFDDICNGPNYFPQFNSGFTVSCENFLISYMQTVGTRKLTEELKIYCTFYFDEDLELYCSERKKFDLEYYWFFCKTLILTMIIEQLHVSSAVDFTRK